MPALQAQPYATCRWEERKEQLTNKAERILETLSR
jgi:hypothetical protein